MSYKKTTFYNTKALILLLASLLVCTAAAFAGVKLPAVISDNMVFQLGIKAPIWGWAEPGAVVTVGTTWQDSVYAVYADEEGRWMAKIDPPDKPGGPHEIIIGGKNTIKVKNVLVGEVWVCSGQSNMEWSVKRSANAEQEIASANYPNIRLFTVKKNFAGAPQKDCTGSWSICSPETVPGFSAVAYYFGRELHSKLDVPIGLIQTSWGGTPAEAWTRRDVLAADRDLKPITDRFDQVWTSYLKQMNDYAKELSTWLSAFERICLDGVPTPPEPEKPRSPEGPKAPSRLYNAMIAPLIPYGIRGTIWYQGESNTGRAYQYRKLFPAMIQNWRNDWGQGEFPFYYVQIAPFKYGDEYVGAELREAQFMTLSVPNTGMAVMMDIGNIHDIHPKNKQDVGKRLALWALAKTYGHKDIVCSGPIYRSMKVEGNKIRLFFDHVGSGLIAKGGPLTHFTIAGDDKKLVEANAQIDGDTVVVSTDEIKNPVAVRFAWGNTAAPNLFNREGLPASSFRTDDWPGVTFNQK